jgi:hypothetical protein
MAVGTVIRQASKDHGEFSSGANTALDVEFGGPIVK